MTGVDISQTMLEYASATKGEQHIPNLSFQFMGVTLLWKFADVSFDLVNGRFLVGLLTSDLQRNCSIDKTNE